MYLDFTCSSFAYRYSETSPQIDAAAAWIEGRVQTYIDSIGDVEQFQFASNYYLKNIGIYDCISISEFAFIYCFSLQSVNFPMCNNIGSYAFSNCSSLQMASFPKCTFINKYAFASCFSLSALFLLAPSVCALSNSNAFQSTPLQLSSYLGYFGSIYVLPSLVSDYKRATNWIYYSNRITSYQG